ncbi:MAG TPA: phosphoribosylaminoimidazolesuccinocarboxamide synthase [Actinomycetota bacterium]|nr:phosphoribosylaminoimidazolesuccinocarboxamide synthase [Actinomycetota bacterium]
MGTTGGALTSATPVHVGSGKVREIYRVDDGTLLLAATDRISAYDVVLPQDIPDKGKVLTGLTHHWLTTMSSICPNHMISVAASDLPDVGIPDLAGRAMLCKAADALPVEFVVRGYLSGSGWREYRRDGAVCGIPLPEGLSESDRLPQPLLTPATKAIEGHDENVTEERAAEIAGKQHYDAAKEYALALYTTAAENALERGVIIADTKFEFGVYDGEVILIDEVLTPDSSRFWPQDQYRPGGSQPSFDKQYVRDWLDSTGWDHSPPPPDLPQDVVAATRARYVEAYERVTGNPWSHWQSVVGAAA